jgi:hypothetical protein
MNSSIFQIRFQNIGLSEDPGFCKKLGLQVKESLRKVFLSKFLNFFDKPKARMLYVKRTQFPGQKIQKLAVRMHVLKH